MKNKISHNIGIDEAGRGPLAGPVAVGVAMVPCGFSWRLIEGVNDSKKLNQKKREAIYERAKQLKKEGKIDFSVAMISSLVIDKKGITQAVSLGITKGLSKIPHNPKEVLVKLDGLLKAPEIYTHQKTIIKGDAREKVIGLASIMAKVERDNYMEKLSKKYPKYSFEQHKGYGTTLHRKSIKKFGMSPLHRVSFCKNCMMWDTHR